MDHTQFLFVHGRTFIRYLANLLKILFRTCPPPPSQRRHVRYQPLPKCPFDSLPGGLISPTIHEDGTCEFAFPLPQGHIAFIALADLAAFALLIFQDRPRYSGKTLEAASCFATGAEIANTTSRVAGVQASFRAVGFDEWTCRYPRTQLPVAATDPEGPRNADSWVMFFNAFADDVWVPLKDLGLLKELHPGLRSLEMWMRENAYDGSGMTVLKSAFDR